MGNRRFMLRAYEEANPVRLAWVLADLDDGGPISRDAIIERWLEAWPRFIGRTGKGSVPARIGRAAMTHRAAGILGEARDGWFDIADRGKLTIAAGNLSLVTDEDGVALPPSRWSHRPAAPGELMLEQEALEATRTAGPDERSKG